MVLAMHAPDGFLEPPVAGATALLAMAILGFALRSSTNSYDDRSIPLAGVSAAFVFAAQMVNFPVAAGTTGHLMGGALAAILLGPRMGAIVVAIVVAVQALLFADGGLTALGYNTINMAIVPAFGGWAAFRGFQRLFPRSRTGVTGAASLASGVSVVLGAMAFSLQWLFGASSPVAFDTVFGAVVGVHILIGIGEGLITGLVVAAVLTTRPDVVAGAADLNPSELGSGRHVTARTFAIAGTLVALTVAMVLSQFSAGSPDGLERVAETEGLSSQAEPHPLAGSIFADYATQGIANETASLAIAGASGAILTLVVGWGIADGPRRWAARTTS